MKIHILVATIAASIALAAPADAAKYRKKKSFHRAAVSAIQARPAGPSSHDVYVSGELVGRDPDPFIRLMIMRNPHIWDGPE